MKRVSFGRLTSLLFAAAITFGSAGLLQAQQIPATLIGEWTGGTIANGNWQFITVTLAENDGQLNIPLSNQKAKLTSSQTEGSRTRLEFALGAVKVVLTGSVGGNDFTGNVDVPGTKGIFHLTRTRPLTPEARANLLGAYRFRDGNLLVVDTLPDIPNTIFTVDTKSGEARAIFPRSVTDFISGSALFVTTPVIQTITFTVLDNIIQGLKRQLGNTPVESATRVPLRSEQVRFKYGDVTLAGTLILPEKHGKRYPAVVFTHGGGPAKREIFWGLGYLLAARGIAVLAYDKRGVGESTGNWRDASFEDLADDAVAAANFLSDRTDIDKRQIGFWGLSQGGWIAPLAASRFDRAAFSISLSGGGLSPAEQELFDTEHALQKAGFTPAEINDAVTFQKLKNEIIRSNERWEEYARARLIAVKQKWWRHSGTDIFGPEKPDDAFWAWYRRFYLYDPAPALRGLRAPILFIFGAEDSPKSIPANVQVLERILKTAKHRDYTIKVYPHGLHNLMELRPGQVNDFPVLKRFVPGLFQFMTEWIGRRTVVRGRARR